jgi:hypothetical protein
MTEADWQTGTDFTAHVRFAADRLSPRRQRLLAAGFCRAVSQLFSHAELNEALLGIDHYADDMASVGAVDRVRQRCREIAQESYEDYRAAVDGGESDSLRSEVLSEFAWAVAFAANSPLPLLEVGNRAAAAAVQVRTGAALLAPVASPNFGAATVEQSLVMRSVVWEIVGNPFQEIHFSPSWRTDTAVSLAKHMYDSREFSAMPILADALQDVGCEDEALLNHCRDTSLTHLRGCWVVDLVLGRG